jgi:hypothetical protein
MERALLWFKCAAMHDPVRPVIRKPAVIGWEAKQRRVDLVIERPLRGGELVYRMKGWVTADVKTVVEHIEKFGRLKILDDYDLIVETESTVQMESISAALKEAFNDEVWIELIEKKSKLQ